MTPFRVGAFASGEGTNLQAIIDRIRSGDLRAELAFVLSNNSKAGALRRARDCGVAAYHVSALTEGGEGKVEERMLALLREHAVDLLVLAGYMKKVPPGVLRALPGRVVNLHPALLPAFGGDGFYGERVHRAVLERGCQYTGITIHLVNELYDEGQILWQRMVAVPEGTTVDAIAREVHALEYDSYWRVIQGFAEGWIRPAGRASAARPLDISEFRRRMEAADAPHEG